MLWRPLMLLTLNRLEYGTFRRAKPLLVLTFVALEGATARRRVAELLWPDAQQPDSSLRVALHALRAVNPGLLDGEDPLASGAPCDATELLALRGEAALAAYAGPFLNGVNLQGVSEELVEWVAAVRERLALHVQTETLSVAERSDPATAAALAERAFRLPGAAPAEPDLLRRLLALSLPGSALEAAVRAELHAYEPAGLAAPVPRRTAGRLLGREQDLGRLLAWGAAEGGGVALLSGPGGIGKSTLGRAALAELQALGRQVAHVDAEGLRFTSEVIARLGAALSPARVVPDSWAGLAPLLDRPAAVLLDGVDALEELPDLVDDMRQALPGVRWILTGRLNRLGSGRPPETGTFVLRLAGLEWPPPEADASEVGATPAAQLFVREAGRTVRTFALTPENAALVGGVARHLQGHPLALALAATWLRHEDLEAVYARILREGATLADAVDGGRNLQAVARRSWTLLSPAQQAAALALHAFTDFDPAVAAALGVPDRELDALLDHSFLEAFRPGSERLRLYPALDGVIASAAAERPDEAAAHRRAHSAYFLDWFARQTPTDPAVEDDLGNVLRALDVALRNGTLRPSMLYHLMGFFDGRAQVSNGTDVFQGLTDRAYEEDAPADVQAAAQIACMWLAQRANRLLDAQTLATSFLGSALAEDAGNRMRALNTLASVRQLQGLFRMAADLQEQALNIAEDLGDPGRQAMYVTNLLGSLAKVGDDERVAALVPRARALAGQGSGLAILTALVWVQLEVGSAPPDELLRETAALQARAQAEGNVLIDLQLGYYAALVALRAGRPREALAGAQRAIQAIRQAEWQDFLAPALFVEAEALYALGRARQARTSARRGLEIALAHRSHQNINDGLLAVAPELLTLHPQDVTAFLDSLGAQPENHASWVRRARPLLGRAPNGSAPYRPEDMARHLLRLLDSA